MNHPIAHAVTTVRPMRSDDIAAVVDIHLRAFPGFFLSFLGPGFLSVLYRSTVDLGEIALVATIGDQVTGLVMGSTEPSTYFRRLRQSRLLPFATASLAALLRRPAIGPRIFRALRKPEDAAKPPGTATLLSLAVDPAAQSRGVGRNLVRSFVEECARREAHRVDLTTDKFGNASANAFYKGLGFRVVRELTTPEGRVLNEYELDLSDVEAAH